MFCRRFCRVLSSFLAGTLCCGCVSSASENIGSDMVAKDESIQVRRESGVIVDKVSGEDAAVGTYEDIHLRRKTVFSGQVMSSDVDREENLESSDSVSKNSNWKKAAKAAGVVVGGVTLVALAYLGKLAYDVKSDVKNLFKWLDGVVGEEAIVKGLSDVSGDFFVFVNVVGAIRKLLPVSRRPVFDFLVRFVNENKFMKEVRARYCSDSKGDLLFSSWNNKFVTNYFDLGEEKLDD